MSLSSSLAIGRSALNASQVAMQITGNNFANASTPGYSRQIVSFTPLGTQRIGQYFTGQGVSIQAVNRSVDQGLQTRLWSGFSQEAATGASQQFLSGLEGVLNELGDNSLSDGFNKFFGAWSSLATSPNEEGKRALVVAQGGSLAGQIRSVRSDLVNTRIQLDQQTGDAVAHANNLLDQIADVNIQIVNAEGGGPGQANSLRDQRDQLVTELSQLMDVTVVEQPGGSYNVLVGSTPVVMNGVNRGLRIEKTANGSSTDLKIRVVQDGTPLNITGGIVGGLLAQRSGTLDRTITQLDTVASQLIFQVNKLHSAGYGSTPMTSVAGFQTVPSADQTLAFNDAANTTFSNLPFHASNGGFLVTVKNTQTGASQTVRINVDLDGITSSGAPGTTDDTSLSSLTADLNGVANISATIQPNGTLKIDAATGYSVSFGEDTSGVLAVLGINSYFTGTDATNIAVRQDLASSPGLLAAGFVVAGQPNDNAAALAIAGLQTATNAALGGRSISSAWRDTAQQVGAEAQSAGTKAQASTLVRQNLEAQRAAVSGVSLDEESINLLNYQRQYQGAAQFITAIDEMTQTLLAMLQ